jgi:hypothetical protein
VLSDEVLRFLRTSIGSVWALELLMLLHRDPARAWSVEGLIRELRGSAGIVAGVVVQLQGAGLVEESSGAYRYRPATPELDATVAAVTASYAEFPIAVTQAILSTPSHKIQLFADAFRIKKE